MVEREGRGRHAGGRVSVSRQLEETCHRVSYVSTATCDAKRCGMTCICRSRVECAVGSRTCGHAVTGGRVALRGVGGFPSCPPVRPALRLLTYLLRCHLTRIHTIFTPYSHHIHTIFTYSHHIHVFAPYSQEVRGAFSRIHTHSHPFTLANVRKVAPYNSHPSQSGTAT